MFYAHIVHKSKWDQWKKTFNSLYVIFNLLFLLGDIGKFLSSFGFGSYWFDSMV